MPTREELYLGCYGIDRWALGRMAKSDGKDASPCDPPKSVGDFIESQRHRLNEVDREIPLDAIRQAIDRCVKGKLLEWAKTEDCETLLLRTIDGKAAKGDGADGNEPDLTPSSDDVDQAKKVMVDILQEVKVEARGKYLHDPRTGGNGGVRSEGRGMVLQSALATWMQHRGFSLDCIEDAISQCKSQGLVIGNPCYGGELLAVGRRAKGRSLGTTCQHSDDFCSVLWYGTSYEFSKGQQAQSVKVLWEAFKNHTPAICQETIGERIESQATSFRLKQVFRDRGKSPPGHEGDRQHPAWGKMIVEAGKGTFKLAEPESG